MISNIWLSFCNVPFSAYLIARNRLTSFVRSRSEWCISRQRVWGVPIPALHHLPSETTILTPPSLSHTLDVLERKGVDHWWNGPVSEFVGPELVAQFGGDVTEQTWRKGTDTMDVWFDSGTSWAMLSIPSKGQDRKHRADLCLEGSDQHRGWFQSQLLTAVGAIDVCNEGEKPVSPYGALITHGMVLDERGRKMSKSLGNVISPLAVIHGGAVCARHEPCLGCNIMGGSAGQEKGTCVRRRRASPLGGDGGILARYVDRSDGACPDCRVHEEDTQFGKVHAWKYWCDERGTESPRGCTPSTYRKKGPWLGMLLSCSLT